MYTKGKWEIATEDGFPIIATEDTIIIELEGKHLCVKALKANAERICKCVNGWDELQDELKLYRESRNFPEIIKLREQVDKLQAERDDLLKFVSHWAGHSYSCDCLDEGSPRIDCTCGYEKARDQILEQAITKAEGE